MPQRQDSFEDPKFRQYPGMGMSSSPAGPMGLVQPPPPPLTPPSLGGTTGLGLGEKLVCAPSAVIPLHCVCPLVALSHVWPAN